MTPRRHSPPHTMDVVVTFEYRFTRTPDGAVWSQMAYGYNFFRNHYLRVFDGVKVVARVQDVPTVLGSDFIRVDGPGEIAADGTYTEPNSPSASEWILSFLRGRAMPVAVRK